MTRLIEPVWLSFDETEEIIQAVGELYPKHRVELVRPNELAAALERPINRYHYAGKTNIFMLSCEYVYGIGKAHALVDGNKRIAFMAALVFLEFNGIKLNEPADEFFAVYIKALMSDRINLQMLATVFSVFSVQFS
ncbi:Death-on-curing protein [Stappia aggregata IAM 12614]|uniref:Death-on-curing protein n=1 Tax=Roseibium aggregatum (strain ATCC 25650 / DSM 13394 / JCM 20685 / NBRC 16684 / NCIMB 2208 / IAM 12614 / B1) TaxID=384765 RepID=A0NVG6_ROSAI|nr:type II toxin-antitoxin system death-on-curing family toxin [Roseibium aggregatum]EAV43433.1 Death-on-curing protein [Stappia aggregata IAM 12614] [Roseibium aggregatum IAM 12614]